MLFVLFFLLSFPSIALSHPQLVFKFQKLNLPKPSVGPESITFDSFGRGPYTGISDGRILRYDKSTAKFIEFAFTTPNRSRAVCDGSNDPALYAICGRPLGVDFYLRKNQLFIADAYRGLVMVGLEGGLTTQLAIEAEGLPFKFLDGLSIDQRTGDAYFSDFSAVFTLSDVRQAIARKDSTGRLLKYDYRTRRVTVLQSGLSGANGVALSADCSYVLVGEYIGKRIRRFWLQGPSAFTSEVVATFGESPDNIKRTRHGDFWVALDMIRSPGAQQTTFPTAVKIDGNGNVLRTLPLKKYYNATSIFSEFMEHGKKFYSGSVATSYVGVFSKV